MIARSITSCCSTRLQPPAAQARAVSKSSIAVLLAVLAALHALRTRRHREQTGWLGQQVASILERLLITNDQRAAQYEGSLLTEDSLRVPWLRFIAKIASRDIWVLFVPVSKLATKYLHRELMKIRNSTQQYAATWWMTDSSTQISGEDRVQRVVSAIIRSETTSHAFDSTARRQCPKHQEQHSHSVFRQTAESFVPPRASAKAIARNESNHPVAAASRSEGVTATREHLHNAGFAMYDLAKSGAARDRKAAGRRIVHGVKDLQHADPDESFTPGMVYTMVDQDVYIDSLAKYAGENMVIITPEYNKLAGEGTDSVWYYTLDVNGDVVVTERVASANGATFSNQRPWNYSANDFIFIEHLGGTAYTTYNVHIQYQPGSHHKWVWLARNSTTELSKSVCDMMCEVAQGSALDGVPLLKANNVVAVRGESNAKHDTFLLGLFGDSACPIYSIKFAYDRGKDTSMELTENQYKIFTLMGKNRARGYGASEVKRVMQMHTIWRPGGLEPLLVQFFMIPIEYRPLTNIMYTRPDGSLDDVAVESGKSVPAAPNPAGGGPGVADTKSDAAHDAYMNKRLKEFSNKTDPMPYLKDIVALLLPRFIEQVSGESGIALKSVLLVGEDEIYRRRVQALQAARLQRKAELVADEPMPKTNLKHEVAPKASAAPRGITQFTEEMAIQTGRVGILLKEILKGCDFYQPGNSPHDIATSIRYLAQIASHATAGSWAGGRPCEVSGLHDTDYSKMDETISECIYSWFTQFVLAFVHPNDYDEVKKILESNVDFKSMLNGKPFNTGYKNNSGSGVTTELNTIISAFIEYVSTCLAITKAMYRLRHGDELDLCTAKKATIRKALSHYVSITDDFSHLLWGDFMFHGKDVNIYSVPYAVIGPKFGDDGVAPHLPGISDSDWNAAALHFTEGIGMKLKVSFSRPEQGTYFLGRHYPKPLESLASYADVHRAIRKISVARNLDFKKYAMKLLGYWTTDSKTPGIREYLIAVARMYNVDLRHFEGAVEFDDEGCPVLTDEMMQLLKTDKEVFYRVAGGPYCVEDADVPMMTEAIASQVGFSSSELQSWTESLAKCATWDELEEFMLPGMDYDPDAEPDGTVRVAGPVTSLLSSEFPTMTFGELEAAAELALEQLTQDYEAGQEAPHDA